MYWILSFDYHNLCQIWRKYKLPLIAIEVPLPVADLHSKILDAPPPPPGLAFIFMQFWENLAKLYVDPHPP